MKVMRRWEWALPPAPAALELAHRIPDGWADLPDDRRPAPILFVHGICSGAWAFDDWVATTAERGIPAFAVSLRGHGASEGRTHLRRTLLRDYTHDLLQTLTRLPEPPILVGHSMGALVASDVAERYPARGLALVAPAPFGGGLGAGLQQFRAAPLEMARAVVTALPPRKTSLMFHGLPADEASERIARMGPESPLVMMELLRPRSFDPPACPVAVFGAREDRMILAGDVERVAESRGVSVRWVDEIGHEVMLDAGSDRMLEAILDWVAEAVPPGTPRLPGQARHW